MFKLTKCISVIILAYSCITTASETVDVTPQTFPITPFTAQYNIIHKGDPVGTATRELKQLENGNIHYSYQTNIEWLIFSDSRTESSTLKFENNTVTPLHYIFTRSGTGKDKQTEWKFIPEQNKAISIENGENVHSINIDFSTAFHDKLSYQLQQRLNLINNPAQENFVFPIFQNSGKTKNYVYTFDGEEEIILPFGNLKTIRLKREVVEKQKVTYAWFAPDLNYLLVRLHQIEGNVDQFEARLTKYNPNN